MDFDNGVKGFLFHAVKHAVAQRASIVDDAVEPSIAVDRRLYNRASAVPARNRIAVDHSIAACCDDFINHLLCWSGILAAAGLIGAEIVDNDFGSLACGLQRNTPAHSATRACYENHFAVQ